MGKTKNRDLNKYVVSDDYEFVYFVVPKVACSSIKAALLPLFSLSTTGYEFTRPDGSQGLRIHKLFNESGLEINDRQFTVKYEVQYKSYFKFAFVRNPWDRLVSCYSEKLAGGGRGLKFSYGNGIELYKGMPFTEFVEAIHSIPDDEADSHFRSQHQVVCDPEKDNRLVVDFVGRFEKLDDDFRLVAERLNTPRLYLPHMLRSRARASRPYADFYNDRTRKLAGERYEKDIEVFGYSF